MWSRGEAFLAFLIKSPNVLNWDGGCIDACKGRAAVVKSYSTFMSQVWIDVGMWGQRSIAITLSAANYSQSPLKGRSRVPRWTRAAVFICYGQPLK